MMTKPEPKQAKPVASKESLAAAELRDLAKDSDRGPEPHPDAPVARSANQPGDPKSAASRDQATHTAGQRRGEKRSGV
jgi:hypothetical protein